MGTSGGDVVSEKLHVLRWQNPPDKRAPGGPGRRGTLFDTAAAELRQMPGMWGVVLEGSGNRASGMAASINAGVYPCCRPAGSFQAVARMDHGLRTVYARYVGDAR